MVLLSAAVIMLSLFFTYLLRTFVRLEQSANLVASCEQIENSLQKNSLDFHLPYFVTYVVWKDGAAESVYTNDPFLPRLPVTDGKARHYLQKNFFIDGDLNILYSARTVLIGSDSYTIETAMNMDTDTTALLLKGVPSSLAFIVIPVLLFSFLVSLFITRNTMRPVVKMTEKARRISSENLGEKLSLKHTGDSMDENDTLAATFNDLFARLKADFDREKAFTSDVSHELRTPVAVILGQAKMLLRWGKDDPAQTEKSLGMIIKEARSMESTINNLLQLSRLESGRQSPRAEVFCLQELLLQLADETRAYETTASVSVECDEGVRIKSDMELLHQVLTVLLSNSVKFCKASGVVPEMRLKAVLKAKKDGDRLVIYEYDNGPGFADEILPHVFERFYRGDSSHNRKAGGSGLGLSIAKVIVSVLGGSISASNAEGGGACVSVELPALP